MLDHPITYAAIPGNHPNHLCESLGTRRELWDPIVGVGSSDVLAY